MMTAASPTKSSIGCNHQDTKTPLGLGFRSQAALNAHKEKFTPQSIRHFHACAAFPVILTWTKAVNRGCCISWSGLTASRVRRHLPTNPEETTLGHMQLTRQGTHSTSSKDAVEDPADTTSMEDPGYTTSKGDETVTETPLTAATHGQ